MQCFLLHDQQHDNIPRVNIFLIGDLISEIEFIERYDCGQIHVEMNELLESLIKKKIQWRAPTALRTKDPGKIFADVPI